MRIKIKKACRATIDGVTTLDLEKGGEYQVGVGVAASLIAAGNAVPVEPESKDAGPADENNDAGAADENKTDGEQQEP